MVIFTSGYTVDRLSELHLEQDQLYIQKPFGRKVLLRRVREALDLASEA